MPLAVITKASGGLPINWVSASPFALPIVEAATGIAVTKVTSGGLPATYVTPAGAVVPSSWTPAALGVAVRAWYQSNLLTGNDGDPVGSFADSSGNGFTLTRTGTFRPTLAAAEQNGLNTLRFTVANGQSYPLSTSIMAGLSAGSVYFVYKVVTDPLNNGLMGLGTDVANNSHWPYTDGVIYDDFGSTVRSAIGNPSVSLTAYRIVSLYSAANDKACYIDGGTGGAGGGTSPIFTTSTNTVAWNASQPDCWLGANKTGAGTKGLDGWIAEFVLCNGKQSVADRQKMEGYLANKWGLTGNLSASHPYKSVPPT